MALSRRSKRTVLALFVLVVPSICYILLRTGTNYYHSLPVYGPNGATAFSDDLSDSGWYRINLSGFPVINERAPALENDGTQFPGGKIYVAGFVRANVSPAADTLAVNMVRLAKTYKDMERLGFIMFIATDSMSSVTPFEKRLQEYGANAEKWVPVRLPEAVATDLARRMFFLHADTVTGAEGQPLNDTVVLIDSRSHIRGYYDGSSYFATDTLEDEIAVLWKEEMNRNDQK